MSSILNTAGSPQDIPATLANLMNGAAGLHEQRDVVNNPVPTDQRNAGRDFMFGIFFAQIKDYGAGRLDVGGAMGGPTNLSTFPFTLGMNDPIGSPATFNRKVFNIYDAWETFAVNGRHNDCEQDAKAAIYRGQEIFNFLEFDITGVPGFNDVVGQTTYRGTCSTCHNTPNVGGHSVIRMMDIGTAEEAVCNELFPILAVTNKTTGATRRLCDMGRGGNGVWADLGEVPRAAAARPRRPDAGLPRRPGEEHQAGHQVPRGALQHRPVARPAEGPRGLPGRAVTPRSSEVPRRSRSLPTGAGASFFVRALACYWPSCAFNRLTLAW